LLPIIADKLDRRQFGALRDHSSGSTTRAECYWALVLTNGIKHLMNEIPSELCLLMFAERSTLHVDHSTVLTKMAAFGIHRNAIRWIDSFLSNRQQ
jgi:hypothetical protein